MEPLNFTATVVEHHDNGMLVLFSAEGYEDVTVGMPLKPDGVSDAEFFAMYAPTGIWAEQHITRSALPVGTSVSGAVTLPVPQPVPEVVAPPAPQPTMILEPIQL